VKGRKVRWGGKMFPSCQAKNKKCTKGSALIYLKGIFIKSLISIILNRKSRVKIKNYIVFFMSIQCSFSVGLSRLYSIYPIFKTELFELTFVLPCLLVR